MLKRKILSLYILLLIIISMYSNIINALNLPLIDTTITIDAGHGGYCYSTQ